MNIRKSSKQNDHREGSSAHNSDEWKEKYFCALEEFENEQKSASNSMDLLRRGLLSVSLAGEGLDASLDKKLTTLRTQLKSSKDYSVLAAVLQEIESDLIRLDTQSPEAGVVGQKITSTALSFLYKSSLDSHVKKELKAFQKRFNLNEKNGSVPRLFEKELINLLLPLLVELSSDYMDKNPKDGLWERFRKTVSSSQSAAGLTTAPKSKQDEKGKEVQASTEDVSEDVLKLDDTRQFIQKLIAIVYGNTALSRVASALAQDISVADATTLLEYYPKIVNLLNLSRTQEKRAFLDYLDEINSSLLKITSAVSGNLSAQKRLSDQDQFQSRNIRDVVKKVRNVMDTASDLDSLKEQTQEHLDIIVDSLDESAVINSKEYKALSDLAQSQAAELASLKERAGALIIEANSSSADESNDAQIDEITNLPNYNSLLGRLQAELDSHHKTQSSLCICVAQVVSLELITSEFGIKASNKALALLASEIGSNKKLQEYLAYGNEGRFILLKPYLEIDAAEKEIDKLKELIGKLNFKFNKSEVEMSVEFAVCQSDQGQSAEDLLEKVNQALTR